MQPAGPVIILSADKDFSDTLAEQVKAELKLGCMVISAKSELKQHIASALAVITSEAIEESLPCPVIAVKQPPIRLQELLDDITGILHHPHQENVKLDNGYSLEWRQKMLSHASSAKTVSLTDKEAQLLQCLAEAGGLMVTKEDILKTVWGFDEALDTHTLETHIYRLRGKFRELTGDESMIAATEGGYILKNETPLHHRNKLPAAAE